MRCFQIKRTPAISPLFAPARFLGEKLIGLLAQVSRIIGCLKMTGVCHKSLSDYQMHSWLDDAALMPAHWACPASPSLC